MSKCRFREILSDHHIPHYILWMLAFCLLLSTVVLPCISIATADEALHAQNPDWMKYLPDSMQISQINLPGTHDSGTFGVKAIYRSGARTVANSIEEQLNAGIRVFDIRLALRFSFSSQSVYNQMNVIHGKDFIDCFTTEHGFDPLFFGTVLSYANNFVSKHPSEVVIIEARADADNVEVNENLRKIMAAHQPETAENTPYPNVISYYRKSKVPTLGEVRGKAILLFKEADDKENANFYESGYEWYEPINLSATVKYQLLKHHLEKYTIQQQFYGETKDTFIDQKLKNSMAEDFEPEKSQAPMYINTNLTQIHDGWSSINWYDMGPFSCWDELYNKAGFKNLNLNPNKDDESKHQRTGWWRLDFPQDHQVKEIIDSNTIRVKRYSVSFDNFYVINGDEKVTVTLEMTDGKKYERIFEDPASSPTFGTFDLGYYPADQTIKTVKVALGNPYQDERMIKEISSKTITRTAPLVDEERTDVYTIVCDDSGSPFIWKKRIPITVEWLDEEESLWHPPVVTYLLRGQKPVAGRTLESALHWTDLYDMLPLYEEDSNGKLVKINYDMYVRDSVSDDYYHLVMGTPETGYTLVYIRYSELPETGDNINPALLLRLFMLSLSIIVFLLRDRKKRIS